MSLSHQAICHPATLTLLRQRGQAKLRQAFSAFSNPRKKWLSALAVVLGALWLSQAAAGIFLRQPAARESLLKWIPVSLFAYTIWHIIKIATRKPVEPFEWTPAEIEMMRAAPITRTQLISYRLSSILAAAIAKAACFSIVMIPDLSFWIAGFIGALLALALIDLLRVCCELFFHGLSQAGQWIFRGVVLGLAGAFVSTAIFQCFASPSVVNDVASPAAIGFLKNLLGQSMDLLTTGTVGRWALVPFEVFANVILAQQFSALELGCFALSLVLVTLTVFIVYGLDHWSLSRVATKEKDAFECALRDEVRTNQRSSMRPQKIRVPYRLRGFGTIAWRQLWGAYHYRMTVAFSLAIPALLCSVPLLSKQSPLMTLLNIVAGAVFYSFLLLPSALMLDFRRDIDRIAVLKALPIGPIAMTLGQLATPVLICSIFQWFVLLVSVISGSVIVWQACFAAILMIPINALIFAIENYIFMLAPYRRNKEGIDVFLRTILTFTAKGLLFGIALVVAILWAFASAYLNAQLGTSNFGAGVIFGTGIWLMTVSLACGFTYGIIRLYDRFDPSQDAPAAS